MKIAIMQPYFFPYVGYFQLIAAADIFVIYDEIQYTKKGWINRNRMLRDGSDVTFSLPLEKASDYLNICERRIAPSFDRRKLKAQFEGAYRKAPEFARVMPLIDAALSQDSDNLFDFISHTIELTCNQLNIRTPILRSSVVEGGPSTLSGQERVVDICRRAGAMTYINPIGGLELYDNATFSAAGIELFFLRARNVGYEQFGEPFVPWLSIIDVMMFNSASSVGNLISDEYDLIIKS